MPLLPQFVEWDSHDNGYMHHGQSGFIPDRVIVAEGTPLLGLDLLCDLETLLDFVRGKGVLYFHSFRIVI